MFSPESERFGCWLAGAGDRGLGDSRQQSPDVPCLVAVAAPLQAAQALCA